MFSRIMRATCTGLFVWGLLSAGGGCAQQTLEEAPPEDLLVRAWTSYRLGEWEDALLMFSAAKEQSTVGDDQWAMAQYGLATTWDRRRPGEKPDRATAMYQELLQAAPQSAMAPWTELALVRQKHLVPVGSEPDYDAVNKGYEGIMQKYPDHLAARESFLYLKAIQIATLEPAQMRAAVAELERFVNTDRPEFVGPAWSLLAVSYQQLGEQEKRLAAEQNAFRLTEVDPTDPFVEQAWAYWNLAVIAEFEVGDFDLARTYYKQLMAEYPTDIRMHGCKQALARMDELEAKIREEEGL